METPDPDAIPSDRLADLLRLDRAPLGVWNEKEWGEILAHQLAAPLVFDLEKLTAGEPAAPGERHHPGEASFDSFASVLNHPSPTVVLLRMIKEYAKSCDRDPAATLPEPVAMVLYYASVCCALVRCDVRITELTDESLLRGTRWAHSQPWIDDRTRLLFSDMLARLAPR